MRAAQGIAVLAGMVVAALGFRVGYHLAIRVHAARDLRAASPRIVINSADLKATQPDLTAVVERELRRAYAPERRGRDGRPQ